MKLLLDEMLDRQIAAQLRQRGHDVVAVQEHSQWWSTSDEVLLTQVAYQASRVLVTDNLRDFLPLHTALMDSDRHHAGLLLASPSKYPRAKRTLGRWVDALDAYLTTLPSGPNLDDTYAWL